MLSDYFEKFSTPTRIAMLGSGFCARLCARGTGQIRVLLAQTLRVQERWMKGEV